MVVVGIPAWSVLVRAREESRTERGTDEDLYHVLVLDPAAPEKFLTAGSIADGFFSGGPGFAGFGAGLLDGRCGGDGEDGDFEDGAWGTHSVWRYLRLLGLKFCAVISTKSC